MAGQPLRSCSYCGSPLDATQRFCSNCGSTVIDEKDTHTEISSPQASPYPQISSMGENPYAQSNPGFESNPPPPPPSVYGEPIQQQQQEYQPPSNAYPSPTASTYQPPLPSYAVPAKDASRNVLRQMGCGFLVVLLIILALCGGGGYLAFNWVRSAAQNATSETATDTITTGGNQAQATPKPSAPVVTTLHTPEVVYASVQLSISDVQQATSFPDDTSNSASTGILRINFNEKNTSAQASYYFYSDVMLLQLPDGTSVHPSSGQNDSGPAASITRTNWIDFPVSTKVQPAQITLIIGKSSELQISIPLKSGVDLSKYQSKTVAINQRLQPENAAASSWTITNVTRQTSYNAKQATKGNVYIVVALKTDNSSSNTIYPFPDDTMRLQSGATKSQPDANTLPSNIAAGQTNVQGECAFIMPDGSTDFTFIFSQGSFNDLTQQMTANFQIK